MRKLIIGSLILAGLLLLMASPLLAQLRFDPALGNVIRFEDTVVGEAARVFIAAIGSPNQDARQDVRAETNGAPFSVAPARFWIEPDQRVFLTITFAPGAAGVYQGRLTVSCNTPEGREIRYETQLVGTGIEPPQPEMVIEPDNIALQLDDEQPEADFSINISNAGDALLTVNIDAPQQNWLSRDLARIQLNPGANRDLPCHIRNINENGEYDGELTFRSNDPDRPVVTVPIHVSADFIDDVEQHIQLSGGWNLVSINVSPADRYILDGRVSLRLILEPILNRIAVIKAGDGRFCLPGYGYWGIDEWRAGEAFYIKVNIQTELVVLGEPIPPNRPIELPIGWSYAAYYPNQQMRVDVAFQSLVPQNGHNFIKNDRGRFWVLGGNNFDPWYAAPGEGYLVRLKEPMRLIYPAQ